MIDIKSWFKKPFVKTPIILQMDAAECGAISLMIVLAYHGRHISNEEARKACGISRDGSNAADIMAATRQFGCVCEAVMMEETEDLDEVIFPAIAYWKFEHFIVVEGVDFIKDRVYINDPAIGRYFLSIKEFNKGFTGLLLIIAPNKHFVKTGRPTNHLLYFQGLLKRNIYPLLFIVYTAFIVSFLDVLDPSFTKILIDEILTKPQSSWPNVFITVMIGTLTLWGILFMLRNLNLLKLQTKFLIESAEDFFNKLLRLPMNFFSQRYVGDIANRLFSMDHIAQFASGSSILGVSETLSVVFLASVLFLINAKLALGCFLCSAINMTLIYFIGKEIWIRSQRLIAEGTGLYSLEINIFQSIEEIKCMGNEPHYFKKWVNLYSELTNIQMKILMYSQFIWLLPKLLHSIIIMVTISLGSYLIIKGEMTIGSLIAFQSIYFLINFLLEIILQAYESFQRLRADLARIQDVMIQKLDPRLSYGHSKTEKLPNNSKNCLQLKDIVFAYSDLADTRIINHTNLEIKQGHYVSIVGKNGAGKSTLIKLILGLYEPWQGEIYLKNNLLKSYKPEEIAQIIWYIDQDTAFFEGTIRENLCFGKDGVSDSDLHKALTMVFIDEEISKRGGLNCQVLEKGKNFSGGQRQKLEIARAIVYGAEILILDEATSAMDYMNEKIVIENLKQNKITIINITHRPELFRYSDEIFVFQDGYFSHKGTHDDLVKNCVFYQNLLEAEKDETPS